MSVTSDKWIVMVLLAVISVVLGFIPYLIIRWGKNSRLIRTESTPYKIVLTVLSCFGGGVLLSTAVLHLLPEVRETLSGLPKIQETFDAHFPVAEMILLCGFALIYLVEEIAHFIMVDGHHGHHHHDPNSIARHNSIAHGIHLPDGGNQAGANGVLAINGKTQGLDTASLRSFKMANGDKCEEEEDCPDEKTSLVSSVRAVLTLIALSFHAIMEGIAIGIQEDKGMWVMFGAVASHKFVISFCMGMELMTSQAGFWTFFGSIVFFGVISSVGIGIGGIISTNTQDTLPVAVIEALVCGTLIYVVFFEIMNRERDRKSFSLKKSRAIGFIQFVALGVGLVAMGVLSTLTHPDHGHAEEAEDGHDHDHDH